MIVRNDGAELFYTTQGEGAPVVLLHPFPIHHGFWDGVAQILSDQYKLILPDLRGLGASTPGDGPATMARHADDLRRICDDARVNKAVFVGVSIGGYILFEFWRSLRERVLALALCDTKAAPETDEGKKNRMAAIQKIQERGTEIFVQDLLPKLLGDTTRRNRPDIVDRARQMILTSPAKGIIANQQGMAERPDSTPTLTTFNVPVLFVGGSEDEGAPPAEMENMNHQVRGSQLKIIRQVGHYSAMENPEEFAAILRGFLKTVRHTG